MNEEQNKLTVNKGVWFQCAVSGMWHDCASNTLVLGQIRVDGIPFVKLPDMLKENTSIGTRICHTCTTKVAIKDNFRNTKKNSNHLGNYLEPCGTCDNRDEDIDNARCLFCSQLPCVD